MDLAVAKNPYHHPAECYTNTDVDDIFKYEADRSKIKS